MTMLVILDPVAGTSPDVGAKRSTISRQYCRFYGCWRDLSIWAVLDDVLILTIFKLFQNLQIVWQATGLDPAACHKIPSVQLQCNIAGFKAIWKFSKCWREDITPKFLVLFLTLWFWVIYTKVWENSFHFDNYSMNHDFWHVKWGLTLVQIIHQIFGKYVLN